MNKKHCIGCWNNHYNDPGGITKGAGCWSLDSAKVVTQYEISMDAPMNVKANYRMVRKPNCFRTGGYSGTGTTLLDSIPSYAK